MSPRVDDDTEIEKKLEESIEEIVFEIQKEKVIPIIGYDLLFNEFDKDNPERDFLKQLIKKHAQNEDLEKIYPDARTGYELLNAYYHSNSFKSSFKNRLSRTIKEQRLNWNLIPESYFKLASINSFSFFINATFTNTLELAINSYRGVGNNEAEIKASYSVLNYHPTEPQLLSEAASSRNFRIDFEKPTIYNLFGTHDEKRGDYILTDADYIELIYDLIVNRENSFTNLLSYLNEGYILFLGCNFPDWFFRFFIRICVGDRLDTVSPIQRKAVIDSLNKVDSSRSVFISQYQIQTIDIDPITLVNKIFKRFQEEFPESVLEDQCNNRVFVSYCSADAEIVDVLEMQFDQFFIEYFRDRKNLKFGSDLEAEIRDAIDRCCVFLPVISYNLSNASSYFCFEWDYALSKGKKIIPVYKDFLDPGVFLPCNPSGDIKQKIINKNETLGVKLGDDFLLPEKILKEIKEIQYLSRVSGQKK